MTHRPSVSSDYLQEVLTPASLKKLVKAAVPLLKKYDFDAIAFRGISGALVAPILAFQLNKTLLVVRKPKESGEASHCSARVEGDLNTLRYIIIDDFQSSGRTVDAIITEVHAFAPEARCLGALFYREFLSINEPVKIVRPRTFDEAGQELIFARPDDFLKATIKAAKVITQRVEVKF